MFLPPNCVTELWFATRLLKAAKSFTIKRSAGKPSLLSCWEETQLNVTHSGNIHFISVNNYTFKFVNLINTAFLQDEPYFMSGSGGDDDVTTSRQDNIQPYQHNNTIFSSSNQVVSVSKPNQTIAQCRLNIKSYNISVIFRNIRRGFLY